MRWFKKKQDIMTNEEWLILSQMMYRYINRDQEVPKMVNMSDFITIGYCFNPTTFTVISWRHNAAKGVPWLAYKVINKQKFRAYTNMIHKDLNIHKALSLKEQALEEISGHAINQLITKPNNWQSWSDIVEALFAYRDITGNAYLYAVRNPSLNEILQFHVLPADKVKIIGGTYFNPVKGYDFSEVKDRILAPENVVHWKYFNPIWRSDGAGLYGMSPLVPASRIINNDNMGVDSQTAAFANEGVKGIVTGTQHTEIEFTKEQGESIMKKWMRVVKRAQDTSGKGNLAFNRAPLNFVKVGETPVDLGIMESRKFNKEILCNIFRLHPSLLSSDASTLNNLTEARKALMTISVMPDLDSLRDNLNGIIQASFGEEYYVDYDLMAISELQDDIHKMAGTLKTMDWITLNEKRLATDYDERPEASANILWTDMGKVPLGFGLDSGFNDIDEELSKIDENIKKVLSNGLETAKQ